jgi:hypothetical protein
VAGMMTVDAVAVEVGTTLAAFDLSTPTWFPLADLVGGRKKALAVPTFSDLQLELAWR